jgi:thioredoxin reductase (NADPH)
MAIPRKLNVPGEDLPKVFHQFVEPYAYVRRDALVVGGGNSAAEAALFLAEEGARTSLAIWRSDWENRDPKKGAMKHWVREPLELQVEMGRLKVILFDRIEEIREREVSIRVESGDTITIPSDVVFVLVGADADLTMLREAGVEIVPSGLTQIPVYDPETFETNVPGLFVAGHFTHARHIKKAIDVPRQIVPIIAKRLDA